MADTRKFQPSTSAVGEAIRAALGEGVRPVTPGGTPVELGSTPPLATEQPATPPAVTTKTFTFGAAPKRDA